MTVSKGSTKVSKSPRRMPFPASGDGFPLIVNRQNPQGPTDRHSHDFDELVVILEGNGMHITERGRRPIYAGDVFLLRKGERHGYSDTKGLRLVNILFKGERILALRDEFRKTSGFNALFKTEPAMRSSESQLRLSPERLLEVSRLIDQMEEELRTRQEAYQVFANSYFLLIVSLLSRDYSRSSRKPKEPVMGLARAISFIERKHCGRMDIARLCEEASMSRSTFFREFRRSTGLSPIEYLTRIRIFRAMNEIIESRGRITVKEAAFNAGFNDSNYFARQYRRVINEAPSQTRRRARAFHASSKWRL